MLQKKTSEAVFWILSAESVSVGLRPRKKEVVMKRFGKAAHVGAGGRALKEVVETKLKKTLGARYA